MISLSTVFHQINAPCALTATLVNSGDSGQYYRAFWAIFAHFWQILAYFEGNSPSESAGVTFIQAGVFIWWNTVLQAVLYLLVRSVFFVEMNCFLFAKGMILVTWKRVVSLVQMANQCLLPTVSQLLIKMPHRPQALQARKRRKWVLMYGVNPV